MVVAEEVHSRVAARNHGMNRPTTLRGETFGEADVFGMIVYPFALTRVELACLPMQKSPVPG